MKSTIAKHIYYTTHKQCFGWLVYRNQSVRPSCRPFVHLSVHIVSAQLFLKLDMYLINLYTKEMHDM